MTITDIYQGIEGDEVIDFSELSDELSIQPPGLIKDFEYRAELRRRSDAIKANPEFAVTFDEFLQNRLGVNDTEFLANRKERGHAAA